MACRELREVIELAPDEAIPVLWLTPEMLVESPDLSRFEDIPYRMLKIHGFAHDWHTNNQLIEQVFIAAQNRNIPVLIHTGGRPENAALRRYTATQKYQLRFVPLSPEKFKLSVLPPLSQDCCQFILLNRFSQIIIHTSFKAMLAIALHRVGSHRYYRYLVIQNLRC